VSVQNGTLTVWHAPFRAVVVPPRIASSEAARNGATMSATITLESTHRTATRTRLLAGALAAVAAAGFTIAIAVTNDDTAATKPQTAVSTPESHAHPDPLRTRYGVHATSVDDTRLYAGRR
jgi:hypothetical protein